VLDHTASAPIQAATLQLHGICSGLSLQPRTCLRRISEGVIDLTAVETEILQFAVIETLQRPT
jgi:hypothetical protein